MKYLYGQEFDLTSASSIIVASTGVAESACSPHVDAQHGDGPRIAGRASSDSAVPYDGWHHEGSRWAKAKSKSDSGLITGKGDMKSPKEMRATSEARKASKKENEQELKESKQVLRSEDELRESKQMMLSQH